MIVSKDYIVVILQQHCQIDVSLGRGGS
jgi:hypothetical protein